MVKRVILIFLFSFVFNSINAYSDTIPQTKNYLYYPYNNYSLIEKKDKKIEDYILYFLVVFLTSTNVWIFFQTISKNKTQEKLKELDIKKREIELDYNSETKFRELMSNELLKNYLVLTNNITTDINKMISEIKNKIYDLEKLAKDIYSYLDTLERELKKEIREIKQKKESK